MAKISNTSVTRIQEAAEAVCGALWELGWELMGESNGGASTWFIRGDKPKRLRVEVQRSLLAPYLIVKLEWHNLSGAQLVRGQEVLQIDCTPEVKDFEIKGATERAVLRCLEVFRDVLAGEGVAGADALKSLDFS